MGKRGPAKKPTNLALIHGDRASRINQDAPEPDDAALVAPETLSPDAVDIWNYTVARLEGMSIATAADRDALACYCEAVVAHREATAEVESRGLLVPGAMGGLVKNPAVAMQRDAAVLVRTFAREFGLTPSARSDISVGGAKRPTNGPERYFS